MGTPSLDLPPQDEERIYRLVQTCLYPHRYLSYDLKQDLQQEALLAALAAYRAYDGPSLFRIPYVRRITHYRLLDYLRKFGRLLEGQNAKRDRPPLQFVEVGPLPLPDSGDSYDSIAQVEQRLYVQQLLTHCDPQYQPLLLDYMFQIPTETLQLKYHLSRSRVYQKRDAALCHARLVVTKLQNRERAILGYNPERL